MQYRSRLSGFLLALVLCLANSMSVAADSITTGESLSRVEVQALDARQQKALTTRTQNIDTLLDAFRNIASETGNAHQISGLEQKVAADKAQAMLHYQANDIQAGQEILERTYAVLKTAIVQMRDGSTLVRERQADDQFEIKPAEDRAGREHAQLSRSIDALLGAYLRVAQDKGLSPQAETMQHSIASLKVSAEDYFQSGEVSAGSQQLQGAYNLIKVALAALHEGDTLFQSLDFASREEEYSYYVEKTQSQQMAIELLLEMSADTFKNAQLVRLLEGVRQMQDQAAVLAADNNFDPAIALMDKAFTRLQSGLMMAISTR